MQWTCKHCTYSVDKRGQLLKHFRLKHGGFTRQQPIQCLHQDCACTFKSFNALKVHLSRWHSQSASKPKLVFHCQLCEFKEPCIEDDFFTHIRSHLRLKQKVECPYEGCDYQTNVYATFNSHRSKVHRGTATQFKGAILVNIEHPNELPEVEENEDTFQDDSECDLEAVEDLQELETQLERNLAALFLKMQSILNIAKKCCTRNHSGDKPDPPAFKTFTKKCSPEYY